MSEPPTQDESTGHAPPLPHQAGADAGRADSPNIIVNARPGYRLQLRVAAKLMLAMAFFSIVYVFLSAFLSGDRNAGSMPAFRVAIDTIAPGQTRQLTWQGRPVLIHRRTSEEIASLSISDDRLVDPQSASSEQPEWVDGPSRSRQDEWFVAIAVGTDFSCPIEFVPASDELFQGAPWPGGYADSCRGSRYDQSGRVYADQYADENLMVPAYAIEGKAVMLGR